LDLTDVEAPSAPAGSSFVSELIAPEDVDTAGTVAAARRAIASFLGKGMGDVYNDEAEEDEEDDEEDRENEAMMLMHEKEVDRVMKLQATKDQLEALQEKEMEAARDLVGYRRRNLEVFEEFLGKKRVELRNR
jgi:molecular chaperone GrpE (heat shock protein)